MYDRGKLLNSMLRKLSFGPWQATDSHPIKNRFFFTGKADEYICVLEKL